MTKQTTIIVIGSLRVKGLIYSKIALLEIRKVEVNEVTLIER